jgi:hypothetical protein
LIWEKERRARKRAAKQAQLSLYSLANMEYMKNPMFEMGNNSRIEFRDNPQRRSEMWKISNQSKVPMLSDHLGNNTKVSLSLTPSKTLY